MVAVLGIELKGYILMVYMIVGGGCASREGGGGLWIGARLEG